MIENISDMSLKLISFDAFCYSHENDWILIEIFQKKEISFRMSVNYQKKRFVIFFLLSNVKIFNLCQWCQFLDKFN